MRFLIAAAGLLLASVAPGAGSAQTAPSPPQQVEPGAMERDALEAEVTRSRSIIRGGAVFPRRPDGCGSPESRQFDFWIGDWDVSPGQSPVIVADSVIRLEDQGCVILENWRPFRDAHGHSITTYDAAAGKWRQSWADAGGTITQYAGVQDADGVIRLENLGPGPEDGRPAEKRRMNFARTDENTVRQWGELYDEATQTWKTEWSFTYRRRGVAGARP